MDHNPFLKPWRQSRPNEVAGKGRIEDLATASNIVWQTRPAPLTAYESDLAEALIGCFEDGARDLEPLVAALNKREVMAPDGGPWTTENFEREMKRLGI
jgi:hypothetical protein